MEPAARAMRGLTTAAKFVSVGRCESMHIRLDKVAEMVLEQPVPII